MSYDEQLAFDEECTDYFTVAVPYDSVRAGKTFDLRRVAHQTQCTWTAVTPWGNYGQHSDFNGSLKIISVSDTTVVFEELVHIPDVYHLVGTSHLVYEYPGRHKAVRGLSRRPMLIYANMWQVFGSL